MKIKDFKIGLEFMGSAGLIWRCTDVGTRTITAIQVTDRNLAFLVGPPYIVEEKVFDERDMKFCDISFEDAIKSSMNDPHPGYSSEAVWNMLEKLSERRNSKYPYKNILHYDRVREDGEILHPYHYKPMDDKWVIDVYLPFTDQYTSFFDKDFIKIPIATSKDLIKRKKKIKT